MSEHRRERRVGELLKEEISKIIRREVKDPRIGFVSVTDVEVSGDLRHAKVFVSVYGDEQEKKDTMAGLEKATGFIRKLVGDRVKIHHTPEILFCYDDSIEHGVYISKLINKVRNEEKDEKEKSTSDKSEE